MLRDIRQQEERQDMKSIVLGILAHVDIWQEAYARWEEWTTGMHF